MAEPTYLNVWRNRDGSHQWTDGSWHGDREFLDRVAARIASDSDKTGIYRLGVLRIHPKQGAA